MKSHIRSAVVFGIALVCSAVIVRPAVAFDDPAASSEKKEAKADAAADSSAVKAEESSSTKSTTTSSSSSTPKPKYPPYADALKEFKTIDGLIKLHRKENKVYAELDSHNMNRDFIVLTSIARGIGEGQLLGGMTWGFGDDVLWQFRKVEDNVQIVRRNVRFRAAKGSPEEKAVKLAYTDSVLFALPIVTTGSGGSLVVDLSPVFMSDLPQISMFLPGFTFSSTKSTWSSVKGFK
ncbi:MAG TPA: DUF5118 domain-containing protein, partial [Pirellulales bacterium]|nr:DUF5118 domain-containing protein [Pirellulales bacterium]